MRKFFLILFCLFLVIFLFIFAFFGQKKIQPLETGYLIVDNNKNIKIWYETFGNKKGRPIFFLHGGPGGGISGTKKTLTQSFDLKKDYIILHDQRGCEKSIPNGAFEENNTQNLSEDIEKLRKHLKIEKIDLWGHSWGSTLALFYAQKYYKNINKLFISGVFLARKEDAEWLYYGNKKFFPDLQEEIEKFCKNEKNIPECFYKKINLEKDKEKKKIAILNFMKIDDATFKIIKTEKEMEKIKNITLKDITEKEINFYEIFFHYEINSSFIDQSKFSTKEAMSVLNNLDITILNGRYDFCTPLQGAWDLKKLLPNAKLIILEGVGHSRGEWVNARTKVFLR
jgi:proline iminopeptidase